MAAPHPLFVGTPNSSPSPCGRGLEGGVKKENRGGEYKEGGVKSLKISGQHRLANWRQKGLHLIPRYFDIHLASFKSMT